MAATIALASACFSVNGGEIVEDVAEAEYCIVSTNQHSSIANQALQPDDLRFRHRGTALIGNRFQPNEQAAPANFADGPRFERAQLAPK